MMPRSEQRQNHQLRSVGITPDFTRHAEGSVLIAFGETKVLCNASVTQGVPRFLKDAKQGWLTAEYGMLPRATHTRSDREAARGKQSGRTQEIQRLIGRSLRSCIDLSKIEGHTIVIDCDVIQADGGTRTAAITGGYLALVYAIQSLQYQKKIKHDPITNMVTAVSLGLVNDQVLLDLDYQEDQHAQTDLNLVVNSDQGIIEIQGTAEQNSLSRSELNAMLDIGYAGLTQLQHLQQRAIAQRTPITWTPSTEETMTT